ASTLWKRACPAMAIKQENSYCHPDSCILHELFTSHARLAQPFHTLARNDEMHEIPNLPFPSLNPEEQTPATHSAEPAQADHDGDETSSADQE
ncbi:hypothetical protein, partial [Pseudomonas sp.]